MTTETYTVTQLREDETLVRLLAGEVLESDWCDRCSKKKTCTYWNEYSIKCRDYTEERGANTVEGPLEVISERLMQKCLELKPPSHLSGMGCMYGELMLSSAIIDYWRKHINEQTEFVPAWMQDLHRWLRMTLLDRCICCLVVLLPERVTI